MLSYSALRPTSSSTIQLLGLALFNALFLGFACVAVVDAGRIISVASNHPLQTLIIFIPVMIGITELVYVVALYPIFREIGWLQYKSYGGDRLVKSMLLWYQVRLLDTTVRANPCRSASSCSASTYSSLSPSRFSLSSSCSRPTPSGGSRLLQRP